MRLLFHLWVGSVDGENVIDNLYNLVVVFLGVCILEIIASVKTVLSLMKLKSTLSSIVLRFPEYSLLLAYCQHLIVLYIARIMCFMILATLCALAIHKYRKHKFGVEYGVGETA